MIDPKLYTCRFFRHALISTHRSCSVGETIFWDGFHTLRTICLSISGRTRSTHDAKILYSLYTLHDYSVTKLSTFSSELDDS